MAVHLSALIECSKCQATAQTSLEATVDYDGDCVPTGTMSFHTRDVKLPEGWRWGRYGIGIYCPQHKED